ncbi:hypothetical protein NW77_007 [Erwinia phage phiEa2809]|uniref:Uncharacterized protein n=1 Tax=Erwinia phage phiEa2809 TaxID=1564096 RepID=A0A0A0YSL6_9CAUD|nr:hypothetical protein NW77_007 [Erwinia phage phiEa2809]AIX13015.1 hypothetical protein NW77_007 [Erwinia phage phiEa2809]
MLIKSPRLSDLTPQKEGQTHYNIYSQSRTELGRFLSHFQHHPMETEDGQFDSLEGYWYWLYTKDDRLRYLSGYDAKRLGQSSRRLTVNETLIMHKIIAATKIKLDTMPLHLLKELHTSRLPLIHAYVHQGRYTIQTSMDEIIKYINHRRVFLKIEY